MRVALIALFAFCAIPLHAQATECNNPQTSPRNNARSQQAWDRGTNAVYADATALVHDLGTHGIHVQCIRASKEAALFSGQKGAAWFKSDQGIFEVWFLPTSEVAATVVAKVTTPPLPINLPSGSNQFFVQHQNMVFHINGCCELEQSRQLTELLRKTYQKS